MIVKNLDNGREMKVGSKFLAQQPMPVIVSGKMYEKGVWVPIPDKPVDPEVKKIIDDAAKPVAPVTTPVAPAASTEVVDPVTTPGQ